MGSCRPQQASPRKLFEDGEPKHDVSDLELDVRAFCGPPIELQARLYGSIGQVEQADAGAERDSRPRFGWEDRTTQHIDGTDAESGRLGEKTLHRKEQADRQRADQRVGSASASHDSRGRASEG